VHTVGLLGDDYIGLKPRILVAEGEPVAAGTPILVNKDLEAANIVSPVPGRVRAINRGARRKLISIEISVEPNTAKPVNFAHIGDVTTPEGVAKKLCAAGLWTGFRTRPYSKVPDPESRPSAIFITAMESEPLAADPSVAISQDSEAFAKGVETVSALSEGSTYVCCREGATIPATNGAEPVAFSGPHPAGLAGTHIHFLEPPSASKTVWSIGYQDVIWIGRLVLTGRLDMSCIVALGGPLCANPRLVHTVAGASLADLTVSDLPSNKAVRMISGSVLSGRMGSGPSGYLGRYARQVTVIEEDEAQIPMGWIRPMVEKYAVQPVLGSALAREKKPFPLTSNLNGGRRAMAPLGTFETLMPQDFLPTQLLRALLVMDTDQAQALGALELDEEDLGLVGFACPAKYEYGLALRDCLTKIEKEG